LTYKVDIAIIAKANGISDPSKIEAGQKLLIPGAEHLLEVAVYRPTLAGYTFLPVIGTITSRFGVSRQDGNHTGVDIAADRGAIVRAVLPGVVTFSGKLEGYGKTVRIRHSDGLESLYAHNSKNLVKKGQRVSKGQKIAQVGRSGNASGYHLHFELIRNGRPVDPLLYLK
jgi:murein DD-endopeptidase MepM/ murein hydrolase activator NlpD